MGIITPMSTIKTCNVSDYNDNVCRSLNSSLMQVPLETHNHNRQGILFDYKNNEFFNTISTKTESQRSQTHAKSCN